MRVCSLGSGSKGNTAVVSNESATLLIDCGFSATRIAARLEARDLRLEDVDALLVTHEHIDHVRGLAQLRKRREQIGVHMTPGTARSLGLEEGEYTPISPHGKPFTVGDFSVTPFPVPHDACEPVQFKIRNGNSCIGFLTDSGMVTEHAVNVLKDCSVLVIECNYDAQRLSDNREYPERLKKRIRGSHGHLGNGESRALLEYLSACKLRHVVAAHLSEQNNLPELALASLAECLPARIKTTVASQEHGFDWIEV